MISLKSSYKLYIYIYTRVMHKDQVGQNLILFCFPIFYSTYDNFCEILRNVMFSKCDKEMEKKGIPCDCPIPTGLFSVPTQSITITEEQVENIPSALSWFVEVCI